MNEKLSYKNYENQIVKWQALVNPPPKPMSEHVAISFAKENVDALINCVKQDTGFSQGIPVAAFTIHRCLVYWKSFEAENTSVFDRLIQMIGSAIENQEKNDRMAYWLSNTSSLLFLLQKTGLDTVRQVEVKYPALLFNKQLTAFVEKIYGIILDNSKKELKPSLSLCLQVPKMTTLRGSGRSSGNNSPTGYWRTIIESLHSLLSILKQNFVPPVLIRKIFTQIFSYINVELFNSLLRQECFSSSNVENVKNGLDKLERWCSQAKEEYAGSSWDEVRHIGQAVAFLVLSVQQLHRICKLCGDDKFKSRSVSSEVTSRIREVMAGYSYSAASELLWLEDDSSIPFSADDIFNSLREKDFSKVKPAAKLLENPAFRFLQEDPSQGFFCYAQGYSTHFFCVASFLWTTTIAFTLHRTVVRHKTDVEDLEPLFHLYVWGTSLVVTVIRSIGNDPGRVGVWCWSETGRTGKAVHFITFYAPLWGAILFNGLTYFQVIRMINNATRMAVGMSDRSHPSDTRADMKALNRWGYYPLILIGSWAFGTINRIHDFIDPGHKIFWLSFLDVGMAALMGLFNSIAYGLNSSVRRAIHERLDL
ncbi:hypothetical protein IFM89_028566 [Coptis chinensis]|uniref:G-protein coupled receptors family 2 profile 2 domain-containing protein n=1 Tax=Coptis chinensis TaxID=261450 RepID=A0A835IBY3_9MAGN|nr:hypothetical protein IFM89_028566 [Coptis chinensis]